jgi:hypothetical protein
MGKALWALAAAAFVAVWIWVVCSGASWEAGRKRADYDGGYRAGAAGLPPGANPYPQTWGDTRAHEDWARGWIDGALAEREP